MRLRPPMWAGALGGGALLASTLVASDDGLTLCPFALMTGTACPGCGLTRATGSLLRGDIPAMLSYHPLVPVVAVWVGGWLITVFLRSRGKGPGLRPSTINRLLVGTGTLFVATWVFRLLTGALPPV